MSNKVIIKEGVYSYDRWYTGLEIFLEVYKSFIWIENREKFIVKELFRGSELNDANDYSKAVSIRKNKF